MTRALRNCVMRLERALRGSSGAQEVDLAPITEEELGRALLVPWGGEEVAQVSTIPAFMPTSPVAAYAIEQAAYLMAHAFNLGHAMLGFQRNEGRYLDAALPPMFPEPRSPAAAAMVEAIRAGRLRVFVRHIGPAISGGPPPDGWRRAG